MKIVGIIFIAAGLLMCFFTSVSFTQKKKVVDLGPIEINKEENRTLGWPVLAGVGIGFLGIALVASAKKQTN
jgi:hypothetical protein